MASLLEILRLSQAFYGYACPVLLAQFCGRVLTLVLRLLLTLQCTRSSVGSLSLLFPKVTLQLKLVISPWTANSAYFLHVFIFCLPKLTLTAICRSAHRKPVAEGGGRKR